MDVINVRDVLNILGAGYGGGFVNVGSVCIDRNDFYHGNVAMTLINLDNISDGDGIVTNVCLYLHSDGFVSGAKIGIFHLISGSTYKCRSIHDIGVLTGSGAHNVTVNMSIKVNDVIGLFLPVLSTQIVASTEGNGGLRQYSGDACVVNQNSDFSILYEVNTISLYGT